MTTVARDIFEIKATLQFRLDRKSNSKVDIGLLYAKTSALRQVAFSLQLVNNDSGDQLKEDTMTWHS